jgi:hypothetical protein
VPEGMRDQLSEAAVALLRAHRQAHGPRPRRRKVVRYCAICREVRDIKVLNGESWGQCTVCGSLAATGTKKPHPSVQSER